MQEDPQFDNEHNNDHDRGYYNAIFAGDAPPNMMLGIPEKCWFIKQNGALVAHARDMEYGDMNPLPDSDERVAALKKRIGV